LRALDRGGTLAVAGIHLSDIPPLHYGSELFQERQLRSVTANTRADGEEFLRVAADIPLRPRLLPPGGSGPGPAGPRGGPHHRSGGFARLLIRLARDIASPVAGGRPAREVHVQVPGETQTSPSARGQWVARTQG